MRESKYEVIIGNYDWGDFVEGLTLEESLDEIAYRATVRLAVSRDQPQIVPGIPGSITGMPTGGQNRQILFSGVVWTVESARQSRESITLTLFDQAIYLAKSEDEYLFPAGQSATARLKRYAADWGIDLGTLAETKVLLSKAVRRQDCIYSMIRSDLQETVSHAGDMYRPRMSAGKLDLVKLGGNQPVWELEYADKKDSINAHNLESIARQKSLEGTVTQVKVLGNAAENLRSPVLALVNRDTGKYGTLQKIVSYSQANNAGAAKTTGEKLLSGPQEIVSVRALDINTVRAGDKIKLTDQEMLVISVSHELGSPGHMALELGTPETVKGRFYGTL